MRSPVPSRVVDAKVLEERDLVLIHSRRPHDDQGVSALRLCRRERV
jgi:hypothetical protein